MNRKKICAAMTAAACLSTVFASMPTCLSNTYASNVVVNTFEEEYEGWYSTNDALDLEAVNGAGYGGSRGMTVVNRTSSSDGAASSKGLYLWGGVNYTYSFDVFSKTEENFHISLLYRVDKTDDDGNSYVDETTVELIDETVDAGKWTTVSSSYKAPEDAYEFRLTITTDSTNDFVFDNVTITEQKKIGTANAAPAGKGLKDEFGAYFRVGNILNSGTVQNSGITGIMLKDHNAIECENETKPDATIVANGSTDTNVNVSSNRFAAIADFCSKNGIGFRGHTLVWHSQTPEWFFKQGFNNNGGYVSKQVMEQRMESYIKNMFAMYAKEYPNLDLYAYDVCNEVINDGTANQGGLRPTNGTNGQGGSSAWVRVYGDNSFVKSAFKYARQYAPKSCKLFYNDYNEFANDKQNCIINTIIKPLKADGLIDGMGMQSHLNCAASNAWGDTNSYLAAMDKYLNLGVDVQVTELDLSTEGGKYTLDQQATKYKAIFQHAVDWNKNHPNGPNVTLVQVWGPNDNNSWVGTDKASGRPNSPLLYNGSNQPKSAYTAIQSIVPDSQWTTGLPYTGPGSSNFVPKPVEKVKPDANGYYFHHSFEDGVDSWTGRGGASVASSSTTAYDGSKSLYCTDRTDSWNGASFALDTNPFEPGTEFSFSADVCALDGADSTDFKFTLQYTGSDGETYYDEIASGSAPKGAWLQLANTNYKIPEGASNLMIYVETADKSIENFYVDDVYGAVAGKQISGPAKPIVKKLTIGDLTFDGITNVFDYIAARRGIVNGISDPIALRAADVDQNGTFELADLIILRNFLLGKIDKFPEPEIVKPDVTKFEKAFSGISTATSWKEEGENNPCTTQRFGADPGWLVYKDRLYLYTTADEFEYQSNGNMQENTYASGYINCISTADMVNWTDHGQIPVAKTRVNGTPIAKWANNAWAPDAAWKNIGGQDKFFLYFANNGSGIGVITADDPAFTKNVKDPLGHELISRSTPNSNVTWLFDPGVYYDPETDTGIIAYGGGVPNGKAAKTEQGRIAKLGEDMISIVGTPVDPGTPYLFEDSSMIKIGDTWYYSFCHNWSVPQGARENGNSFGSADIGYMTSKDPLKGYQYQGVVFGNTGSQRIDNGGNNHHSVIYFKNKYYVAYHSRQQAIRMTRENGYKFYNSKGELTNSADGNYRSTQINEASLGNGKITCSGNMKGCTQIEKIDVFSKVQAETMSNQSKGISVSGVGDTTVKGKKGEWIKVSGPDLTKKISSITAKGSGEYLRFTVDKPDGEVIGYIDLTSGEEQTLGAISSPASANSIYITFSGDTTLDYWFFS